MKLPSPYTCDQKGCGKAKNPTNGWFLIVEYDADSFRCIQWDQTIADEPGVLHACSAECASKLYATWLSMVQNVPQNTPSSVDTSLRNMLNVPVVAGRCESWTERVGVVYRCVYGRDHKGPHSFDSWKLIGPHIFNWGGGSGTPDRDCLTCGLPDRDPIHRILATQSANAVNSQPANEPEGERQQQKQTEPVL